MTYVWSRLLRRWLATQRLTLSRYQARLKPRYGSLALARHGSSAETARSRSQANLPHTRGARGRQAWTKKAQALPQPQPYDPNPNPNRLTLTRGDRSLASPCSPLQASSPLALAPIGVWPPLQASRRSERSHRTRGPSSLGVARGAPGIATAERDLGWYRVRAPNVLRP